MDQWEIMRFIHNYTHYFIPYNKLYQFVEALLVKSTGWNVILRLSVYAERSIIYLSYGNIHGRIPIEPGLVAMSACISRYPKSVSLVRGRRVLRFVMAEGTWTPTGACEPNLKLTVDQKGSCSLCLLPSPLLCLPTSSFFTLSFTPATTEPGKPLVCQSAPRFRRESFFSVVASRQVLDGCCWSALLCQRFISSRRCSLFVHPTWKVSDAKVHRTLIIKIIL